MNGFWLAFLPVSGIIGSDCYTNTQDEIIKSDSHESQRSYPLASFAK